MLWSSSLLRCGLVMLLWLVAREAHAQGPNETNADLGQVYFDAFMQYDYFPPLDDQHKWNTTDQIQAVFISMIKSIDVISPAQSLFTVSARSVLYFNREACNQTETQRYACDHLIGDIHFLIPEGRVGDSIFLNALHADEIHRLDFLEMNATELTPAIDIAEDQVTYRQQFDVKTYPYEYHTLVIKKKSQYSNKVLKLSTFPLDPGVLNPSVPQGWTLRGIDCYIQNDPRVITDSDITGGEVFFPTYVCEVLVSRENTGWWLTSYLLFFGLNLIAYIGGLGVASHLAAEGRDDKDAARNGIFTGMRMNGVFGVGLLLTYVFQVQIAPYNMPVEFWPSIPASTVVYVLGLFGIMLLSFLAMFNALLLKKVLVADGFTGNVRRPYDLAHMPVEGEAPDEELPVLNKKLFYSKSKSFKKKTKADHNEGEVDNPPVKGPPEVHDENEDTEEEHTPTKDPEIPKDSSINETEVKDVPEHPIPVVNFKQDAAPRRQPLPGSRKSNQKIYSVLSIQEAALVNKLMRMDFIMRTLLISAIAACSVFVLFKAHSDYQNAIDG